MKKSHLILKIVLATTLAAILGSLLLQAQEPKPSPKKASKAAHKQWEYKLFYSDAMPLTEDNMNQLGLEGWELVSYAIEVAHSVPTKTFPSGNKNVSAPPNSPNASERFEIPTRYVTHFKRPLL